MTIPSFLRRPRKKIAKRQLELRNSLWPGLADEYLWSRHTHDGFTTIPKAMPLIMSIMDDMAKGQPVGMTYLELWCRTFDENFASLSKSKELSFHSGFDGQRAERTWKGRLEILKKLHFIDLKDGSSGSASYVLIWNPYKIIKYHHDNNTPGLRQDKYNALLERMAEIGDDSLAPPPPPPAAPPVVTPAAPEATSIIPAALTPPEAPAPATPNPPKST